MLGKHNFKERLRKMEKQDKHDRFSIRKLTIGAASVLIGFAFMGLNISSVQASSNPLDQIKEEQEQSNSNKSDNNSDQSDQAKPQINLEQVKNSQSAGQNSDQTEAANKTANSDKPSASDQDQASQKAKEVKPDVAQPSNDQVKAGASEAKGNDQAKPSVKKGASNAGNKVNDKSAQASDASSAAKQSVQGQNDKADNAQGKTETSKAGQNNAAGNANNEANAAGNKSQRDLKSADLLKGKNDLATEKNSIGSKDTTSSINKLQAELNRANALEKTDYFKGLDQAKQNQLEALVKQANEMMQNYQTQELGISLLELPEEQNKNKKSSNSASTSQSFDVGKLNDLTGNLGGLLSSLVYVPGQATQNVGTWNDFKQAYSDRNVTTINLTQDITVEAESFSRIGSAPALTIDGGSDRHILKLTTNAQIATSPNITFKNLTINIPTGYAPSYVMNTGYGITITMENVTINNGQYEATLASTDAKKIFKGTNYFNNHVLHLFDNCTFASNSKEIGAFDLGYGYSEKIENNVTLDANTTIDPYTGTAFGKFDSIGNDNNISLTTNGPFVLYGLGTVGNGNHFKLKNVQAGSAIFAHLPSFSYVSQSGPFSLIIGSDSSLDVTGDNLVVTNAPLEANQSGEYGGYTSDRSITIRDNGTFVAHVKNFNNTKITTTQPKKVDITFDSPTSLASMHLNLTSNVDLGIYADRNNTGSGDDDIKQWTVKGSTAAPIKVEDNAFEALNFYEPGIQGNKTIATEVPAKGDASYIYRIDGQPAFNLNLNTDKFKRLAFGTDVLIPSDAGRYDATAGSGIIEHAIDVSSDRPILKPAGQVVRITDSTITVDSNFAQNADDNLVYGIGHDGTMRTNSNITAIKWINGVITTESANNYDPKNEATSTPLASGLSGDITVDADGNAVLNSNFQGKTGDELGDATIEIDYKDGTSDYVPVILRMVHAEGKNGSVDNTQASSATNPINITDASGNEIQNGSAISNTTDANGHVTNTEAESLIANATANTATGTDPNNNLVGFNPTYTFVDADGNALTAFPTDNAVEFDSNHMADKVNVKVSYWRNKGTSAAPNWVSDGYQIVHNLFIKVKKSQADIFKGYNASGNITAHVINTGDATSYTNGLISTGTQVTYQNTDGVDQTVALSTLNARNIVWATNGAPDLTKATDSTPETATATVTFNDGSKANFSFNVTVAGASVANNEEVVSGEQPTSDQATNAIDLSGLPSGTTATVVGWVNATENPTTHEYDSISTPASYSTNWSSDPSATNTTTGYVEVKYGDNTYQIVPVTLNIQSKADGFNNLDAYGDITAHVVNTGDVVTYQNGLIGTDTSVSYTKANGTSATGTLSSLGVTGITWATNEAPNVSEATSSTPETATATVTFSDNSTATISFNVTVVGATASSTNQSVVSGKQPDADQAKAAINNADATTGAINLSGLPSGTTATVGGWVNATETGGKYNVTTPANYSITWSSGAANTVNGYVQVNYSDGTSQIVPVTLDITSLASSVDPNKSDVKGFNVHANATSADIPSGDLTLKNGSGDTLTGWTFAGWTTRSGSEGSYTYTDVPATGTDDLASYFNDSGLTNGTKPVTLYAKVTMHDLSTYYVPKAFTLTVVGAVANSSASTNHGTALTASAQLQNYSTLHDDFGSAITSVDWTDANGTPVDASTYWNGNTDNDTATNPKTSVTINGSEDAYITVKYSDGTKQTVWIPLKIKSDLDNNGSNITLSANSKDVHYGQALSDADAIGLLKNNNNPIAAGDVSATDSTKEFKSIQWVDDLGNVLTSGPETSVVGTSGEDDVAAHIKITFQDDSYITKDVTIKVHSGYKNDAQHLTITSGDKPSDDDAKAAIYNANDLSNNYNATSFAWAQDADGTAMTSSYVTDGTNNDTKHAWVVITYTDGAGVTKKQVVQVNDLTIHNMANSLTVSVKDDGLKTHAVSSGSTDPDVGSLVDYFTVKDGSADASSEIDSATWKTAPNWTDTTDASQNATVTLKFKDGSSKDYQLKVTLVGANVAKKTYLTNRNDVPNSDAAKGKVGNASDLSAYNPTYGWYSDASGTTALTAADVAEPTPAGSPKTVYLKIDYHKTSTTGTEDGYQIIPIQLTIQNGSANYKVTVLKGITTHVGAPESYYNSFSFVGGDNTTTNPGLGNYVSITRRSDNSPINLTTWGGGVIANIKWGHNAAGQAMWPDTSASAPSSQTAELKITFGDNTATNPDIITVDIPVTVLGATAKSDISTNHGHALTPSDEISNLNTLNDTNLDFSAPAADVAWALDDSGTALPSDFWDHSTDGLTATDSAGNTVSDAKDIYLIVHYKKGTADDGTQAIKVPVKIKSDRDNEAANYSVDTNNEDIHYGQSVDPVGLIRRKNADGSYSDLTDNDIGSGHAITNIAWVAAPNTSVVSDNSATPDVRDVTGQIQITFSDTSTLTTPLSVTLHVHSGYNNASHTENVVSGTLPSADDAKAAIANATDLSNNYHATGFAWAKDASGTSMDADYIKSTTNTTKSAWVKITYSDGATQVVKVNDLKITSQANHYTPEPTLNPEGQANGVVAHVNGSIDMSNLPIRFKYTDAAGNTKYEALSHIIAAGGSVAWNTNSAGTEIKPDLTKDSNGAHNFAVIITYADHSKSTPVQVSVNVIGAKAKASASTNHGHALTASDEIDNLNTLENDFHVASGDVSWTDASGNPINASTYWKNSTDRATATNPTTGETLSGYENAYLTVHFKKADGTSDGNETVWIPLQIKSDADNVDPETGIQFAHNDRSVTVHADSHSADLTDHNITVIETTTGTRIPYNTATGSTPNGWTFGGWATRSYNAGAYHYTLVSAHDLNDSLSDSNLDANGKHDVTDRYAVINLPDGSTLYTPAMTIHVLGAVGQNVTFNHADAVPAADTATDLNSKTAIKNATALSDQFGTVTYQWMKNTGTAASPTWTNMTANDFNHREVNEPVIVRVKYGNDTNTQDVHLNLTIHDDADEINTDKTNAASSGNYDTHVGAKINGPTNFGNVDLKNAISFRDANNHPLFLDNTGAPTWHFAGFVNSATGTTPISVDVTDSGLTAGVKDNTNLYAYIQLPDGSFTHVKMNNVKVYGGYEQKTGSGSSAVYPTTAGQDTTTLANKDLTDEQAQAAIANSSDLNSKFSATGATALTYEWSTDGIHTGAGYKPDVSYNEISDNHKVRTAHVIITYGDGTKQAVQVHYNVKSLADHVDPETGIEFAGNDRSDTVHADSHSADPSSHITLIETTTGIIIPPNTAASGHPANGWVFSGWTTRSGSAGAYTYTPVTAHDLNDSLSDSHLDSNGKHDVTDRYAEITLIDGSKLYTPAMTIHVLGAVGQNVTFNHADAIPDATTDKDLSGNTAIKNATALNNQFGTVTYTWMKNTGTVASPTWVDMTADDFNTHEDSEPVIVRVKYGNDDNTQDVHLNLTVRSDADQINTDKTNAASSREYTTHVGAKINGSANFGNVDLDNAISFRDANNNPMFIGSDGKPTWTFAGFVDSATGTTPIDVNVTDPVLTDGVKDNTSLYAYIKLHDGSYTHVKMNHVKVYGGYEAKTTTGSGASAVTTYPTTAAQDPATGANKALTSEQAQAAIANSSTLNGLFSAAGSTALKYEWSDNGTDTGAGHQPDVNYNETSDNTKVRTAYVIITYGDGTKQAVQVHYNVKSLADRVDPTNTDDYNASHTVYDTHVNSDILTPGSVDLTKASNFEDGRGIKFEDGERHDITSSVTSWTFVGWKTKSGNAYNDATASDIDVTDSGLTNGSKNANASDGKIYAALKMSDGSTVYVQMKNIKVYGGYTDSTSASFAPGTDLSTTTSQNAAKGDINNNSTLSTKFDNSSSSVKYEWKKQSGSSYADIPVTDTTLTAGQTSKTLAASDGYGILITYGDGRTQFVKKDIQISTSDGEANNSRLSGTIITVEEGHTLTNGKNNDPSAPSDAQRAVLVNGVSGSTSLPAGTGFAFVGTVDTSTPGDKAAIVHVTYPDNSSTKPDIHDVDVIVKVLSQAEEYNPAGRDLTVNRNANVNRNTSTPESADAVRAEDGISNVSALPNNASYSWAGANPDVSQAGSVVPAVIKVTYHDGSSDLVQINIHVNGTNPGSMASRFDPQGQDLRVHTGTNLGNITAIHDTDSAASGTKSFIRNAGSMPAGTTYSWVTEPNTASVGTKTGVIKVTFADHSTKSLGVNVIVWNDASISTAPTGQNIHITSGQDLNPSDGIANKTDLSHVASSGAYSFTTTPSNINHGTTSVTTPTAVIVHYADGSQSVAVPIFVTVDPVTAPGTTPTDAERYHARGTTIVRNMNRSASLTNADAQQAVVVDPSGASAVQGYAWVNDDFKNTALHSSGLKAGYVKITFNDNSSATVLAYVDVKSDRDRYANELSGKTTRVALNTPDSDASLQAQNNVNVPSSVPANAITGYAWVAAPSTATVGTFPESVRVSFADGSSVEVATTLVVYDNRTDAVRNHDALSTNDITKHIGDSITDSDATGAIVDPGRLVGSPTFGFNPTENTNIVDNAGKVKAPAGNKWGIIDVNYGDGSHDTVAVLVHVKSYASEEDPAGKNLTTDVNVVPNASDGISNKSDLTHVNGYTWASAPDVTTTGRTVNATVRVTYSDGSTTDVPILVTVNGSMHHKMADRYDPQGQNLRVHMGANISDPLHIHDTYGVASDPTSAIANSADMPSGTTYSWVETPDVSTVGDKSGVIKVTFRDSSSKTVGITVTVWNDASVSAVPEGQDIYKHVGDSINANEGIENASALHNVSGYGFQGVTVPSTITAAAGTKPETVVVTYADGSTNLVPIQVIVAENTTPAPGTPDHRTDAQRYSAVGKTINKDLGSGALSSTDAQNAVTVQAGAPLAMADPFVWTSDNFKNTATTSAGLKSGFVTVTYRDGSQKQVRVYVNVQSAADRLRHAFTGKPETVNQGATIPAPSNGYGVQTTETVPSGTTYAWQTAPSSAVPGSFPEAVVITFADHSHITVATTLTVRDERTDADFNMPTAHDVTVHVGNSLPAASSALDNISSLTHYTNTTWQGSVDTSTAGDKPAVLVVHYADGSHKDLGIIVHVVDDASIYDPQGKDLTTDVGAVPNASDGISNKSSLPSGTSYAWVSNPDVSAPGTTVPGMIKVTYADHSSETVLINIKVNGTENHNNAFSFTPEGKNLTTTVGHEPNAADGISNKWNSAISVHDNDSHHNLPDNAHFSWQIAPDVSTAGDKNAVIKVSYADGSHDEVGIIVKVIDDAHPSGHVVAPRGQNIETTVGHQPNAADGIANKSDLSNVSGYHFASPVDVSTAGTKAATVVVGFTDGSSQDVPVFVIVRNGSTPTPGVSHEADHYHPIGQTIDKDESTTANLNSTDAKNAIANNSSLPANASYAWTDSSFANSALRTSGLKSGQVTITYHDGSQTVVDVFVKVTSDADRYNPSPRPVVVNPSDPNHPSDPSDPTNRTPGVDPSTVPSGTTTSWPKKPDGTPDVPDTTVPGSHPTNIVVTYPDGSHRTIPTVINVPDNRTDNERFNPSGKPFTIDPAHPSQSGDRTRPRDSSDPTNPMPGVDPSTVPAGTTTSWPTDASGNPTLPPTTPGDHTVNIVVHYPDGHTATVSTTVHVAAAPAPSAPSYVAPAPDEDHDLVFFDPENNDQVVETLPDEIVGEAETDLPADSLRDLIATNIPDGYVLAPSFRVSDMLMPTDTSAMRIPVLRRRLVFVTKQGKKKIVVSAIFGVIHGKQWSIISKSRMMALIKKYMPKGYKLANLYKIERTMITDHRDIEIPVQKKAKRHVRKTARHAKRHVARRTKRR